MGMVGLLLVLDAVDGPGSVMLANTHMFRDSKLKDVKVFQVHAFLQKLELFLLSHRLGAEVPVIIGDDLNSQPQSSVYELFSTGIVLCVTKTL